MHSAVRTMVPTPRALEIQAEVGDLDRRVRSVFAPVSMPDPADLDRTFTILSSDMLIAAVGPDLLRRLATEAPAVRGPLTARADPVRRPAA
ncbi:hypothetical protein [Frankia sp. AiPa1]|uniref:hypothetical protein n=1 Tax=Frankia sp. AiPa1 TaxID=573492 RepID=UPI00202B4DB8|nr:hypothetical protein [Frankia sp. AiPa1]MCL9762471.1 hypothetical protein [Frankia sp. AiPa1]